MTEARITCTCPHIIIADLGLHMTQGSVVYVDEAAARKSKDLLRVARVGGVDVRFVTRAQVVRQPVAAAVGRPRRELPNLVARVSPIPPIEQVIVHVHPDMDSLAEVMKVADDIFDLPEPTPKNRKKRS